MMNFSDGTMLLSDELVELQQLTESDPTDEIPPYTIAELYSKTGKIKEALVYYAKAVHIVEAKGSQETALLLRAKMCALSPGDQALLEPMYQLIEMWECEANGVVAPLRVNRLLQLCDVMIRNFSKHTHMIMKLKTLIALLEKKRDRKDSF